jgi:cephalosporin hydroxylase
MRKETHNVVQTWQDWKDEPEWQIVNGALKRGSKQYPAELRMMLLFVQTIRPSVVVEVGTDKGGTMWGLAHMMEPGGLIVSIDLPHDYVNIPGREEMMRRECPVNSEFIVGDSHSDRTMSLLEGYLQGRSIDFLFVDGDHSYAGSRMDFDMYSPLIRKGGWMGWHDTNPCITKDHGASVVWKELTGFKFEFNLFSERCGIGIWRKD